MVKDCFGKKYCFLTSSAVGVVSLYFSSYMVDIGASGWEEELLTAKQGQFKVQILGPLVHCLKFGGVIPSSVG